MPLEHLIAELEALGLTRNEALAYVTLLENDEPAGCTGYEVANRSGIPRSAVYTVLRRLETSGGAFAVGQEPARYLPTPPAQFLDQIRAGTTARIDRVRETLERTPKVRLPEPLWIVDRYEDVIARIDQMVRAATKSLHLSLWPREVERLMPAFWAVADRPLHRVLHCPDRVAAAPPGFSCWFGALGPEDRKAGWSHKARVVKDRAEALIGGTEPDVANRAVWTSNPSIVDLAADAIVLDITLLAERTGRDCAADVAPIMRPHLSEMGLPDRSDSE